MITIGGAFKKVFSPRSLRKWSNLDQHIFFKTGQVQPKKQNPESIHNYLLLYFLGGMFDPKFFLFSIRKFSTSVSCCYCCPGHGAWSNTEAPRAAFKGLPKGIFFYLLERKKWTTLPLENRCSANHVHCTLQWHSGASPRQQKILFHGGFDIFDILGMEMGRLNDFGSKVEQKGCFLFFFREVRWPNYYEKKFTWLKNPVDGSAIWRSPPGMYKTERK